MKTKIILLLIVASVALAGDLSTTTSVKTNANLVTTTEVFTRDGLTNLVREALAVNGTLFVRQQTIFHDGYRVLVITGVTNGMTMTVSAKTRLPFNVSAHLAEEGKLTHVSLTEEDGRSTLDLFTVTNGLVCPVPVIEIITRDETMRRVIERIDREVARGGQNKVLKPSATSAPQVQH